MNERKSLVETLKTETVRRILRFMPWEGTANEPCIADDCGSDAIKAAVRNEDGEGFIGYVCSKHACEMQVTGELW